MTKLSWMLTGCAVIALAVPEARAAGPQERAATIGSFAVDLGRVLGQRPADAEAAARSLRAAGVTLGPDLNARLTLGVAARILTELGIEVTRPSAPGAFVSDFKARWLAGVVGRNTASGPRSSDRRGAREQRKGCPASPSRPDDCDDDDGDDDGGHDGDHDGDQDGGHDGDQDGGHDGDQDGGHDGDHDGGHDGDHDGGHGHDHDDGGDDRDGD